MDIIYLKSNSTGRKQQPRQQWNKNAEYKTIRSEALEDL